MPVFPADDLRKIGFDIFKAAGASKHEAEIVSNHLVKSNLVGHDSHGVIRIQLYLDLIRAGGIKPGNEIKIVKETPSSALIDGNQGFGQVVASKAMAIAIDKAKTTTLSAVGVHYCNHVGRLGDFPVMAAQEDMIGIAMINNHGSGQLMAPFGGRERRLSPNPISFAFPSGDGEPVMLDMTTSTVAGGKVDLKRSRKEQAPKGWFINAKGEDSTDPNEFFGPPQGALLPLGGILGHKGFGLAFVIDILSGALTQAGCSRENPPEIGAIVNGRRIIGNGLFIMVINIANFVGIDYFKDEVDELIRYVKTSPKLPGVEEIFYPGEVESRAEEKRNKEGIFVEDETWEKITQCATSLGLSVS